MTLTGRRVLTSVIAAGAIASLLFFLIGTSSQSSAAPVAAGQSAAMSEHHIAPAGARREAALRAGMRTLWAQHMAWTYNTIVAFAADSTALKPSIDRLLKNQSDIGDAIKPYYGPAAARTLTGLLRAHITGAVPVLTAAKAGNTAALNRAIAAWKVNARQIADFLSSANPSNWPRAAMRRMMVGHITQTVAYAGAILGGDWKSAIRDYNRAEHHMTALADMLSTGIVARFPQRF